MNDVYVSLTEVLQNFLIFSLAVASAHVFLRHMANRTHAKTGRKVVLKEFFKEAVQMMVVGIVFVGTLNLVKRRDIIENVSPISIDVFLLAACCVIFGLYVLTMLHHVWKQGRSQYARMMYNSARNACWAGVIFLVVWGLVVVACMFF